MMGKIENILLLILIVLSGCNQKEIVLDTARESNSDIATIIIGEPEIYYGKTLEVKYRLLYKNVNSITLKSDDIVLKASDSANAKVEILSDFFKPNERVIRLFEITGVGTLNIEIKKGTAILSDEGVINGLKPEKAIYTDNNEGRDIPFYRANIEYRVNGRTKSSDMAYIKRYLNILKPESNEQSWIFWTRMIDIAIKYRDFDIYEQVIKQLKVSDGAGTTDLCLNLFKLYTAHPTYFVDVLYKKHLVENIDNVAMCFAGEGSDVDIDELKAALSKTSSSKKLDFIKHLGRYE